MESGLTFEYPAWFIIFCVLLGAGYTAILYYRDQTFKEAPAMYRYVFGVLRFLGVTFLAFLLLGPLLKYKSTATEKPIIVVAQDNSLSVVQNMSPADSAAFTTKMQNLIKDLGDAYDVRSYSFGSDISEGINFSFDEKVTDISQLFNEVYQIFSNQNIGAFVIATDGIYNQGSNPIYLGSDLNVPVYAIALGDTQPKKDLVLKKVYYNQIVYLGDRFSMKVDAVASNLDGEKINLVVSKIKKGANGQQEQEVLKRLSDTKNIDSESYTASFEIILDANQTGIQHYQMTLEEINGEVTTINNQEDVFIDVLDGRQKILLLGHAPHPDMAALKRAIESNKNYEVTTSLLKDFRSTLNAFNLVILHQLPAANGNLNPILNQIKDQQLPVWFVLGNQSDIGKLNQVQSLIKIRGKRANPNEVQGHLNKDLTAFSFNNASVGDLELLPPLLVPYGQYATGSNAQLLLKQKIGSTRMDYPLLAFHQDGGQKVGMLCGEGFWRWQLYDFQQHSNQTLTNELVNKMVQWLSVKEDKRQFRVKVSKKTFNENEPILFDAELYDDNYELTNGPEAQLNIVNSEGKEFPFKLEKTDKAYTLNAGNFPYGNYSFKAALTYNNKTLEYDGQFTVNPLRLESLQSTANHRLLHQLSQKYGGQVYYPENLEALGGVIKDSDDIKPVYFSSFETKALINQKWIFFVLLGLLALEWLGRKWQGAY